MAHRADLNSLTPAQRQSLVNLMLSYLTDAVVADHMNIVHSGLELFTGHRAYIAGMEASLTANGAGAFVPLPVWDPADPIPPEFNVVKAEDDGTPRPPLVNLNPNRPLPPEWDYPAVCEFESGADLGNAINGWHGGVHIAIGGTMANIMIASAAPIFWCWHAFVDHIYWNWQLCQVPCPDLTGCSVHYAKVKLRQSGLTAGSITHVPRYLVPPERVPQRYVEPPAPYRPPEPASAEPYEYEYAGQTSLPPRPGGIERHEHVRVPVGTSGGHPGPAGPPAGHEHEDAFRHPRPDYSHLLRGPRVLSQFPAPGASMHVKSRVDLIVLAD